MKKEKKRFNQRLITTLISFLLVIGMAAIAGAVVGPISPISPAAPASLKTEPVPEPSGIDDFITNRDAAIQLGKALFWDMQLGSDGKMACATCHYHAGSDHRTKNQLSPGLLAAGDPDGNGTAGDQSFQVGEPNSEIASGDFPFHQRQEPVDQKESLVATDSNDVISSQGIRFTDFVDVVPGQAADSGTPIEDTVFNVSHANSRRVAPRNAPSVINGVFNFAVFYDGRANNVYNGRNPFGAADASSTILVTNGGSLEEVTLRMTNAALASQAMGPPLSDMEMSYRGRTWAKIGRKMLNLRPLVQQFVHPNDSVLGELSRAKLVDNEIEGKPGLQTSYSRLIMSAFKPKYWSYEGIVTFFQEGSSQPITQQTGDFLPGKERVIVTEVPRNPVNMNSDEYSQMEANFSLFFGLSVMLYESTLISDDSRFDQYAEGSINLTDEEKEGLDIFFNQGRCGDCHGGPEFSNAAINPGLFGELDEQLNIERMPNVQEEAFYDRGFYDTSITRFDYDIGRGGSDPFGYPLSFSELAMAKEAGTLPAGLAAYVQDLPCSTPCPLSTISVNGAFKTTSLRNAELTGPYFHSGGVATLMQVVDFYSRGGNFPTENIDTLNPFVAEIGHLQGHEDRKRALVSFLLTLTDDRVKQEKAPFDHPQLFIPDGHSVDHAELIDETKEIPPVGTGGRQASGLSPLLPFLDLDPYEH